MSDLIDKKEFIAWLDNWFSMNRYYHPHSKLRNIPYGEVIDILERMPTVPAAPRWVRCEDDKPKKNGRYIVFDDENGAYSAEFRKGRLRSEWTDEDEGWCDFPVTHWMPLIEPPREESHEP